MSTRAISPASLTLKATARALLGKVEMPYKKFTSDKIEDLENIIINDDVAKNMVSAQNNLDIETLNGSVTISGKVATKNGDIVFKRISAQNATINTINSNVIADTERGGHDTH